jgi:hypothetical protein
LKLPRVSVASTLMSLPAVVMTVSYVDAILSALLGDGCVSDSIVSQGRAGAHARKSGRSSVRVHGLHCLACL